VVGIIFLVVVGLVVWSYGGQTSQLAGRSVPETRVTPEHQPEMELHPIRTEAEHQMVPIRPESIHPEHQVEMESYPVRAESIYPGRQVAMESYPIRSESVYPEHTTNLAPTQPFAGMKMIGDINSTELNQLNNFFTGNWKENQVGTVQIVQLDGTYYLDFGGKIKYPIVAFQTTPKYSIGMNAGGDPLTLSSIDDNKIQIIGGHQEGQKPNVMTREGPLTVAKATLYLNPSPIKFPSSGPMLIASMGSLNKELYQSAFDEINRYLAGVWVTNTELNGQKLTTKYKFKILMSNGLSIFETTGGGLQGNREALISIQLKPNISIKYMVRLPFEIVSLDVINQDSFKAGSQLFTRSTRSYAPEEENIETVYPQQRGRYWEPFMF
jgi:hypothetical protein